MGNEKYITIILSSFLLFLSTVAVASDCREALIQDRIEYVENTHKKLSYLNIINRESYNKVKNNFGLAGNLLVNGTPISGSASYDEFNEKRRKEFQKHQFKESVSFSIRYSAQVFGDNALEAYKSCLDRNRTEGLKVLPISYSNTVVYLRVKYIPSNNSSQAITLNFYNEEGFENTNIPAQLAAQFPEYNGKLPPNSWVNLVLRRPNEETRATIALWVSGEKPEFFHMEAKPVIFSECSVEVTVQANYPVRDLSKVMSPSSNRYWKIHDNVNDQYASCEIDHACRIKARRKWKHVYSATAFLDGEAYAEAKPGSGPQAHYTRCRVARFNPPRKL